MNILIVDDDKGVVRMLADFLRSKGHKATCAYSGSQGLEYAVHQTCDLIFLDFDMPDITGLEFTDAIRRRRLPMKIFIISGYPVDISPLAQLRKVDGYLQKPFKFKEIEAILAQCENQ